MYSNLFSILSRLSSRLPSSRRFHETFTHNSLVSRPYAATASSILLRQSTANVVAQLDKLDKWVEEGNKVKAAELKRIIRVLRNRGKDSKALEVSEWTYKNGLCRFSPSDHAVQLDLIGKVHGPDAAESYFNKMSDDNKNEKTYGALLNCYVRECLMDKSLSHVQTMKEMGYASTVLTYNDLMCLYANLGQYEKVPDVLAEMKKNGVSPDHFSYRTCITSYGMRSDINGMEKLLEEMESQNHIEMDWKTYSVVAKFYIKAGLTDKAIVALKRLEEKVDGEQDLGYNHLISLYAGIGNKIEVLRFWELKKVACKRYLNKDYMTMLGALVKLEELEVGKALLKEWESCGNGYDFRVPNTLLIGYCEKGLVEEGEALLEDIAKSGKTPIPNSWSIVASGYIGKKEMLKAMECMKKAFSAYVGNEGWRPKPKVITSILSWLGDEGKVEDAETFVGLLKDVVPADREMYHTLLKAYLREGKEVDGLLKSMKADGIDEDEETKNILSSRQS